METLNDLADCGEKAMQESETTEIHGSARKKYGLKHPSV